MFINQYMLVPTFKYPQLHKEGREIFGNSSWAYGIDISQAFYHIEIDPNYRKYLRFFRNGKYYTFDILGVNSPKTQANEDGLRLKSFLILPGYIFQETKCNGIGNALPSIPGM